MGTILTNVFGALVGVALMFYVGWVATVTSPHVRMERACSPVGWVGRVSESFVMLIDSSERSARSAGSWFDGASYGCQFILWRVFYEEDWKLEQAAQARQAAELQAEAQRRPGARPAPSPRP